MPFGDRDTPAFGAADTPAFAGFGERDASAFGGDDAPAFGSPKEESRPIETEAPVLEGEATPAPPLSDQPPQRHRTTLSPDQEPQFQQWYSGHAARNRINPNPDDPRHQYDYRGWWQAIQRDPSYAPRVDPRDGFEHGPSEFKDFDHPTMWKERFLQSTGKDPDDLGLRDEAAGNAYIAAHQRGALDTAKAIGSEIVDAALYHVPGAFAAALEGDEPFTERDWKDFLIERSRQRTRSRATAADKDTKTAIPGVSMQDVRSLGPSLGFSTVGAGAGVAAGIPAGIAGTAVGGPVGGTVAGYTAGGAASGVAAYRMSANQFTRDLREAADQENIQRTGQPLSDVEFNVKAKELAPLIREYGLWEAIPEAAGNVIGFGILRAGVKTGIGRLFGTNVLTRLTSKLAALYGEELATETVTQQGQHNVEVEAGLSQEPRRDWTSASDLVESFKEVAPTTVLQTTLMAGGGKAGMVAYDRLVDQRPAAAQPERQDPIVPPPGQGQTESGPTFVSPTGIPEGAAPAETIIGSENDQPAFAPAPQPSPPTPTRADLEELLADERPLAEIQAAEVERVRKEVGTGEPDAPVRVTAPADVTRGAERTEQPTPAQAEAGNYRKRHMDWNGLDVSIETEQGQTRSGLDPNGKPWSVRMPVPYGYIKRTRGGDGDQLDVYIGGNPQSPKVFVIDQIDPRTGKFDEHKAMLGFADPQAALQAYRGAFSDGSAPARIGSVNPMTVDEFKTWLHGGNTRKAVSYTRPKAADAAPVSSAVEPAAAQPPAAAPPARPGATQFPFDSAFYVESALRYIRDARAPLTAIHRHLGITPQQARRVLATAAARKDSGLRIGRDGSVRRIPKRGPLDIAQFIASEGGIRDEAGEMKARDFDKAFIPGFGKLVRKDGLSPDEARALALEAGYLKPEDPNAPPTTSIDDLYEALDETMSKRRRAFSAKDQSQVDEIQTQREAERADDLEQAHRQEIRAFGKDIGEIFSKTDIDAIAVLMDEHGLDAETAVSWYAESLAIREDEASSKEKSDAPDVETADRSRGTGVPAGRPRPGPAVEPGAPDESREGRAPAPQDRSAREEEGRTEPGVAPPPSAPNRSQAEILADLDALTTVARARMEKADPSILGLRPAEADWFTEEEMRRYDALQAELVPHTQQERADARVRVAEKRQQRIAEAERSVSYGQEDRTHPERRLEEIARKVAAIKKHLASGKEVRLATYTKVFRYNNHDQIKMGKDGAYVLAGYSKGKPRWDFIFEAQVDQLYRQTQPKTKAEPAQPKAPSASEEKFALPPQSPEALAIERDQEAFNRQLDEYLADPEKWDPNKPLTLGKTPTVLGFAGVSRRPLQIAPSVIKKATDRHAIPTRALKQLLYDLADPIYVMRADPALNPDNISALLKSTDQFGENILVGINPKTGRVDIGRIVTMHGRRRVAAPGSGGVGLERFLERNAEEGRIVYVDRETAAEWGSLRGVKTPAWPAISSRNPNVRTEYHLVKEQGKTGRYALGREGAESALVRVDLALFERSMRSELDKMGLGDIASNLVRKIHSINTGRATGADGRYYRKLIEVSHQAVTEGRGRLTLGHESIHAIRDLGLLKPFEWNTLTRAVHADAERMSRIRKSYAKQNLSEELLTEEAVADMFGEWYAGRTQVGGLVRRAFNIIKRFIESIGNVLKGQGFATTEGVFEDIERGEVGRRPREGGNPTQLELLAAAWHGSPHDFDKFTTDKIGTGEGAQAYGWGLYFSGNKEVADYYRKNVRDYTAPPLRFFKGEALERGTPAYHAGTLLETTGRTLAGVRTEVQGWINNAKPGEDAAHYRAVLDALNKAEKKSDFTRKENPGRLYKTTLAPAEDEYLYWDKPLNDQSEGVREKIRKIIRGMRPEEYSLPVNFPDGRKELIAFGSSIYEGIARKFGASVNRTFGYSSQKASLAFHKAGIPGIKYLDEGSRNVGDVLYRVVSRDGGFESVNYDSREQAEKALTGYRNQFADAHIEPVKVNKTYNYVIFDDSLVNIEEKFAFPTREDAEGFAAEAENETGYVWVVEKRYGGYVATNYMTPVEAAGKPAPSPEVIARRAQAQRIGRETFEQGIEPAPATDRDQLPMAAEEEGPKTEIIDTLDGPREQMVIPGAERIKDKELVERRMRERKTSTTAQKSAGDLPLFDEGKRNQGELFALRREPRDVSERQEAMQGFIAKGQPFDRALRVPFDIFGGVDERGQWKPGLKLFKKASAILTEAKFTPHGRFAWLNGPLETARAGLIDRYGLAEEYVTRDRQRALDERRIMLEGVEILKTLKEQGVKAEEAQILQAVLTGEAIPDKKWNEIAPPIRKAIDDLGQEAVRLGLVSPESYERNRGSYLHRVYLKHEADQNSLAKWVGRMLASRRKRIIGDELKGRGLFFDIEVDRLMRDVPDFAEGRRGTPQKGEFFKVLDRFDETPELLAETRTPKPQRRVFWPADKAVPDKFRDYRDQGVWEVRAAKSGRVTLWRDYTKQEREGMGEILDARYTIGKTFMLLAHDLATGRFYKDISENSDWARSDTPSARWVDASEFHRLWNDSTVEWVRVPNTDIPDSGGKKKWGALSGKWVRAAIWRDLNEMEVMRRPNLWNTLLTQWKLNKTARSPVVHMNNIMSNVVFMDMADVRAQDLVRGIRAYVKETRDYREAADNGAFGADMMTQEVKRDILDPVLKEIQKQALGGKSSVEARFGILGKLADGIWSKAKAIDERMVDLYRLEDEVFRMATYMRRRSMGEDPKQAADFARQQFLDYDIRAPWVNVARRSVLPFISYTYRAVPVIAKSIAAHPWKFAKYFLMAYMANAIAYMIAGDADDEDEERRSMRDQETGYTWIGTPRMLRLPWFDQYGNPVFLDIRRWIPAGDVFDMNQGSGAVPVPAPLQFGGPLMMGAELMLNKQAFTGKEIVNQRTDDWWDKSSKVADWAWKSWMPSAAWVPGSWYWEKIGRAAKGARDISGNPYSIPEAAASSVGVKVKPQDVEMGFEFKAREYNRVERDLKFQITRAGRDYERGLISEAEYRKEVGNVEKKLFRLDLERIETDLGPEARDLAERLQSGKISEPDYEKKIAPILAAKERNAAQRAKRAEDAARKREETTQPQGRQ